MPAFILRLWFWLLVMVLSGAAAAASGQEPAVTPLDMPHTDSGASYRQSVRYSRIATDLYYVDRLNGELPLGRAPRLERRRADTGADGQGTDWQRLLIYGAVLVGLLLLILRAGGGLGALQVRRPGDTARKTVLAAATGKTGEPEERELAEILAMRDRKAALVLLQRLSLRVAAQSQGVSLDRSRTAREILRLLPGDWQYFLALRQLISAGELVQFGGRDLSEAGFQACVTEVRPMLRAIA